jgi:hypothetical protein
MKEGFKGISKMCLLKITTNTPIISSSTQRCFYEAIWGGLRENNVKTWADLPAEKK